MLIAGFPAGSFAANCYIVASGPGAECLIIDPGQDAEAGIDEVLAIALPKSAKDARKDADAREQVLADAKG